MSFDRVTVSAPAKINWMLRILGLRGDGYHDIETIFQTISLFDSITISPCEQIELLCNDPALPVDSTNLVVRAANLMVERFDAPTARIELEKAIPAGGGLGGGSSDAASVLLVLSGLAGERPSARALADLALELGSDVPFFLRGGTCYATGRGDVLTQLNHQEGIPLALLLPDDRILTADAFRELRLARDEGRESEGTAIGEEICRTAAARGVTRIPEILVNDFEGVIFQMYPHLGTLCSALRTLGAVWARLSGSGSTLVGAFATPDDRDRAVKILSTRVRAVAVETTGGTEVR